MDAVYDSLQTWDSPGLTWSDAPAPAPITKRKFVDEFALKLQERSLEDKLSLCIDMEQGLTTTSYVATPNPTVANLAAKRAAIGVQQGKVSAAESKLEMEVNALGTLESELDTMLTDSATNSQTAVSADRDKMTELKIPLRKIGAPSTTPPDAPTNVRGSYGDMNGEVDFQWDGNGQRNVIYFGELAEDPAGPWVQCYVGSKSRCTVKNKTPGGMYYFRVTVERNGRKSNPSELANHRAR
jgi:hypothetical protein